MEQISNKKKISKLAVISLFFIILGFYALPVCRHQRLILEMHTRDLPKFLPYLPSIIPWFIALLMNLLAMVLIRFRPAKQKSRRLPIICIIISLSVIITFSIPLPQIDQHENTVFINKDKIFDGKSSELKRTTILPALDSPILKNHNIIWCSSFQLAWNELKDNIIKAPILLGENQELAGLLNQANQSKQDIMEDEYYARAGLVGENIIETIQQEMKQKYPNEPVPSFEDVLPGDSIVSYSFLSANVRFKIPYFENDKELVYTDSTGNKTSITSFGIREQDDYAFFKLRRQIKILFCERDEEFKVMKCAVDLCQESSPNQIVLAMIEPKETLIETLSYIDQQYKNTPEDEYYHEFGPNDVLLVPNIFWRIVHRFNELEGKTIQNPEYQGWPIQRAMQVIQFRLDRSGAELKSESKLYVQPIPTFYVFDRPFLIYIKKRGADYPFFTMWVDNADLLEKYSLQEK